jgi:hypothetical protein
LPWKRILLISLLFSILVFSLVYYVLPNVLYPLRIDKVPAGAYVVPWMQPYPYFGHIPETFNIDAIMAYALKLNMTFRISMWDGTTRVIPSTVYLGHDSKYLYVGGRFVNMHSNPTSEPNGWTEPNIFCIFFDVAGSGVLKTPEAGSSFGVTIDVPQETLVAVMWDDMVWTYDPNTYKHMMWMPSQNYLLPNAGRAGSSIAAQMAEYDNSTGTVTILFARFLRTPGTEDFNALQMRPGERWVIGFLLELEYQKELDNRVDGWPKKTYGIWSNDSSWWPKLVIDLTNPPPTIPGQTTPDTVTTSDSNKVEFKIDRSHDPNPDTLTFWIYTSGALFDSDSHTGGMEFHIWDASGAG